MADKLYIVRVGELINTSRSMTALFLTVVRNNAIIFYETDRMKQNISIPLILIHDRIFCIGHSFEKKGI